MLLLMLLLAWKELNLEWPLLAAADNLTLCKSFVHKLMTCQVYCWVVPIAGKELNLEWALLGSYLNDLTPHDSISLLVGVNPNIKQAQAPEAQPAVQEAAPIQLLSTQVRALRQATTHCTTKIHVPSDLCMLPVLQISKYTAHLHVAVHAHFCSSNNQEHHGVAMQHPVIKRH